MKKVSSEFCKMVGVKEGHLTEKDQVKVDIGEIWHPLTIGSPLNHKTYINMEKM